MLLMLHRSSQMSSGSSLDTFLWFDQKTYDIIWQGSLSSLSWLASTTAVCFILQLCFPKVPKSLLWSSFLCSVQRTVAASFPVSRLQYRHRAGLRGALFETPKIFRSEVIFKQNHMEKPGWENRSDLKWKNCTLHRKFGSSFAADASELSGWNR